MDKVMRYRKTILVGIMLVIAVVCLCAAAGVGYGGSAYADDGDGQGSLITLTWKNNTTEIVGDEIQLVYNGNDYATLIKAYNGLTKIDGEYEIVKSVDGGEFENVTEIMKVGRYQISAPVDDASLYENATLTVEIVEEREIVWKRNGKEVGDSIKVPKLTENGDYTSVIVATVEGDDENTVEFTAVKVSGKGVSAVRTPVETVEEIGNYEFTVANAEVYSNATLKLEIVEQIAVTWKYNRKGSEWEDDWLTVTYAANGSDLSAFLSVAPTASASQRIPYRIWKLRENGDGEEVREEVDEMVNAGRYLLEIATNPDIYDQPTLQFYVKPLDLNIASFNELFWINDHTVELASGQVYQYSYNVNGGLTQYYWSGTKLSQAPEANWENWKDLAPTNANYSIIGYGDSNSGVYTIKLNGEGINYDVVYKNNTATAPGKYTAEATITPNGNCNLIYEDTNFNPKDRGMSILPTANGGLKITKDWYVVMYTNTFLAEKSFEDGEEKEYKINGWKVGEFPEGGVGLPYLKHGDELTVQDLYDSKYKDKYKDKQTKGYELQVKIPYGSSYIWHPIVTRSPGGEPTWYFEAAEVRDYVQDLITFTLYRNGEKIAENMIRDEWGKYINAYTPVGEYRVEFTAIDVKYQGQHWHWYTTDGDPGDNCSWYYFGMKASYTFEVTEGTLQTANDASFDSEPYEFNFADFEKEDGYAKFFALADNDLKFANYIKQNAVAQSETYWANHTELYGEAPTYTYHFRRMQTNINDFYPVDYAEWSKYFTDLGIYYVYYKADVKNYIFTETAYFRVLVYREIEDPALENTHYTYSGDLVTVALAQDADEAVTLTATPVKDAGSYQATVSLKNTDSEYKQYRWVTGGYADKTLDYTISAKPIERTVPKARDYTGSAFEVTINNEIDKSRPVGDRHVIKVEFDEDYNDGYTEAGEHNVYLTLLDTRNYYWVDEQGQRIENVVDGKITVKFIINKAENSFVGQRLFSNFSWHEFSRGSNNIYVTAQHGSVVFSVYRDEACTNIVRGLEKFELTGTSVNALVEAEFNKLDCDIYYLQANIAANDNYKPVKPVVIQFEVVRAVNSWIVEPSMDNWVEGAAIPEMKGQPKHGTPKFQITANGVLWFSTGEVDNLASAPVGTYWLSCTVEGTDNYTALGSSSDVKEITIMAAPASYGWDVSPSINNWVVGEKASEPVGKATGEGTEVRYVYMTKAGKILNAQPTEVGEYVLRATIYANGVETGISKDVTFTISPKPILTNSWAVKPYITSWVEGDTASNPIGSATEGEVKFSYKDDQGKVLDGKPTTAGKYVLVATVEVEGYYDMSSEFAFMIEEKESLGSGIIAALVVLAVLVAGLGALVAVLVIKTRKKHAAHPDTQAVGRTETHAAASGARATNPVNARPQQTRTAQNDNADNGRNE